MDDTKFLTWLATQHPAMPHVQAQLMEIAKKLEAYAEEAKNAFVAKPEEKVAE